MHRCKEPGEEGGGSKLRVQVRQQLILLQMHWAAVLLMHHCSSFPY